MELLHYEGNDLYRTETPSVSITNIVVSGLVCNLWTTKPLTAGIFLNVELSGNAESNCNHQEMQDEGLWTLIARKLAGEASQDEVNELEELRRENRHINYYIEILSVWWKVAEREGKDKAEQVFNRLLKKLEKDKHNSHATTSTKETRGNGLHPRR